MTKEVFNKIKNWLLEMEITLHYESPNFNSFVIRVLPL